MAEPLKHVQEVADLRSSLSKEVDSLKAEFTDLRAAVKKQMELAATIGQPQVCLQGFPPRCHN